MVVIFSHLSTCPSNPLGMDQRLLVHRETFSSFGRPGSQRFEAGGFPWEFAGEEIGRFAYFCMLLQLDIQVLPLKLI